MQHKQLKSININILKMEDDLNFLNKVDDLIFFLNRKTTSTKIMQPKPIKSKNNNIFEKGR